jgi:hypothetical protein
MKFKIKEISCNNFSFDPSDPWLNKINESESTGFIAEKWLIDMRIKREIFELLYGDLVDKEDVKILDIGSGFTCLTPILSKRNEYHSIELNSHDDRKEVEAFCKKYKINWHNTNWDAFKSPTLFDVCICNDIFPNVDQRIDIFLNNLEFAKKFKILLTYYNNKCYKVKLCGFNEILHMYATNGEQLHSILKKYFYDKLSEIQFLLNDDLDSFYDNGRKIALLEITK